MELKEELKAFEKIQHKIYNDAIEFAGIFREFIKTHREFGYFTFIMGGLISLWLSIGIASMFREVLSILLRPLLGFPYYDTFIYNVFVYLLPLLLASVLVIRIGRVLLWIFFDLGEEKCQAVTV